MGVVNRFEIHLVNLDPTRGREIRKPRPCLVVSPDEMNHRSGIIIIAPLTTARRAYPTRIDCRFKGKTGQIALDQIRSIDVERLVKKLGVVDRSTGYAALAVLSEMFAP